MSGIHVHFIGLVFCIHIWPVDISVQYSCILQEIHDVLVYNVLLLLL